MQNLQSAFSMVEKGMFPLSVSDDIIIPTARAARSSSSLLVVSSRGAQSAKKIVACSDFRSENLRPSILCEAPRASQTCVYLKTCAVRLSVKHHVTHKI